MPHLPDDFAPPPKVLRKRLNGVYREDLGFSGPTRRYVLTVALLVGLASVPTLAVLSAGPGEITGDDRSGAMDVPFLPPTATGPVLPAPSLSAASPSASDQGQPGRTRTGAASPRGVRPADPSNSGIGPADSSKGERPAGTPGTGDRPSGDRPSGDRPSGDRPSGDRPSGDRPSGGLPADSPRAEPDGTSGSRPGSSPGAGQRKPSGSGRGSGPGSEPRDVPRRTTPEGGPRDGSHRPPRPVPSRIPTVPGLPPVPEEDEIPEPALPSDFPTVPGLPEVPDEPDRFPGDQPDRDSDQRDDPASSDRPRKPACENAATPAERSSRRDPDRAATRPHPAGDTPRREARSPVHDSRSEDRSRSRRRPAVTDRPYNIRPSRILEQSYADGSLNTVRRLLTDANSDEIRLGNRPYRGAHRAEHTLHPDEEGARDRSSRVGRHHADHTADDRYMNRR